MAKLKISELQQASTVNFGDLVYLVQSNTSKATTVEKLLGTINGNVIVKGSITANAIVAPGYTSSAANAISAANGTIIYNTQTNKLQVYAAGNWINLH